MGVKIVNRKYKNQFHSDADSTDWLIGNVGDWQQLQLTVEVTIQFRASSSESVSINVSDKTITLNNGKKWSDYGFDIGDTVIFTYKRDVIDGSTTTTTSYIQNLTIVNLYDDTLEHNITFTVDHLSYIGIMPTDRGSERIYDVLFVGDKEPEGCKFRYTHLSNDNYESENLYSLIDGSITEFSFAGLNDLIIDTPVLMNLDGIQSGMAIKYAYISKLSPITESGVTKYRYDIYIAFMMGVLFETPSNLEDLQAPDVLFNSGSLTDNFEVIMYPEWNNPNTVIKNDLSHTKRLGNTGWFNENFNGLDNNFVIESVSYSDEDGNSLSQLDYTQPVNVEIVLSGINNLSNDTEFNIGFSWIPQNEDDYYSKETPLQDNLFINTGKNIGFDVNDSLGFNLNEVTSGTSYVGYGVLEARMNLESTETSLVTSTGSDSVVIKAKYLPNAEFTALFESKSEDDRNYIIWVSVADHSLNINFSDRVSLFVDYNTMIKAIPPVGEFPTMNTMFIEHCENEHSIGVSNYVGFVEDDILARIQFKVDKTKGMNIQNMTFGFESVNEDTGNVQILEEYTVNTSIFPINSDGVQEINFNAERGFKYEIGNNKNWVKILRDESNDDGDNIGYISYFGSKIRWEDWIAKDGVLTEYYNSSLENNGYHNDWIDYLRAGEISEHKINFFVFTDVIQSGEFSRYYNNYNINFYDYDENLNIQTDHYYYRDSDDTLLNLGIDPDTGKTLGVILNTEKTRIEIVYTNLTDVFDITKMYAVTTLEIYKGAGELEHRQLSSIWGSELDNPLIPLTGETKLLFEQLSPTVVKASCLIDPSKLDNAAKYKITGRIGCCDSATSGGVTTGIYEDKYEDKYQ